MICRDFLAMYVPNFHNAVDSCPIYDDMWQFIYKADDGRDFDGVVLHNSGTLKADDPAKIAAWQYKEHGWPISYHWVFTKAGLVYHCKQINLRSPHCGSYYGNRRMLSLCVEGNLSIEAPTDIQIQQLTAFLWALEQWRGGSFGAVGHRTYSNTSCPGELMEFLLLFKWSGLYKGMKRDYLSLKETHYSQRAETVAALEEIIEKISNNE
jgi:hypothetical protein